MVIYFRRRGREGFGQSVDVVIKNVVVHRGFADNRSFNRLSQDLELSYELC